MISFLLNFAAIIGFIICVYACAFVGAIGWHAGRVYAANKYGPLQSTYTVIDMRGKPQ